MPSVARFMFFNFTFTFPKASRQMSYHYFKRCRAFLEDATHLFGIVRRFRLGGGEISQSQGIEPGGFGGKGRLASDLHWASGTRKAKPEFGYGSSHC